MWPNTAHNGIILSHEEVVFAQQLNEAVRMNEDRIGVPEQLRGATLCLSSNEQEMLALDERQAQKLWAIAFMATTLYLQDYKQISDQHAYLCEHIDVMHQSDSTFLGMLETMMEDESRNYAAAKQFALQLDAARAQSRTYFQ